MNEENIVVTAPVPTTTPVENSETTKVPDEQGQVGGVETPTTEKTFTQVEVNEMMRERLARQKSKFFESYELKDEDEFKSMLGKAQSYEAMKVGKEETLVELAKTQQSLWFKENNVNPEKVDDILAYFKGKDLPLDKDSLVEAVSTHPEWVNNEITTDPAPTTTITKLSPDKGLGDTESEEQRVAKMFGLKGFVKK